MVFDTDYLGGSEKLTIFPDIFASSTLSNSVMPNNDNVPISKQERKYYCTL